MRIQFSSGFQSFVGPTRRLSECKPIWETPHTFLKKKDIPRFVEAPLVRACEILYDENIQTYMASAINQLKPTHVWINMKYAYLSAQNQAVAEKVGEVYRAQSKDSDDMAVLTIPYEGDPLASEIEAKAVELASHFQLQSMKDWPSVFSMERFRRYFQLRSDAAIPQTYQSCKVTAGMSDEAVIKLYHGSIADARWQLYPFASSNLDFYWDPVDQLMYASSEHFEKEQKYKNRQE